MFSTFLKEISGYFDRRFLLSAFFPVLAFAALSLGMSLALWGVETLVKLWQAQPVELQVLASVGALGSILFIAYLFHVFQTGLTRLYEGYWDRMPLLGWWGRVRRFFYQSVWDYLEGEIERLAIKIDELESNVPNGEMVAQRKERKRKAGELRDQLGTLERQWFLFLPSERASVMPTRLGNILRASEFYPLKRYNLDSVVSWPRLQSLLPKEFAEGLRDAKANLDLLLVVTTLAGIFALGWELGLGIFTARWDLFLLASLGWLLALAGYFAALQAARSYGELIKAAFDLHRWELLKALHLKLPESYQEERKLWEDVSELLYRNYPPAPEVFRYETEKAKPPTAAQPGFIRGLLSALRRLFGQEGGSEKKA
jgi:hypothetical protein